MKKQLLICDLDNTLYDWISYFVPSFYAMVHEATKLMQCDLGGLLDDFRIVHQRCRDSEHPFALLETATVKLLYPKLDVAALHNFLQPALHKFNETRSRHLKLYPMVRDTFQRLAQSGIRMVACTESSMLGVVDRLRHLDLSHYFEKIYCREDTLGTPSSEVANLWFQGFPKDKVVELCRLRAKPSAEILIDICADCGLEPASVAYVGDSVARDMVMAKKAGVFAIWAAYGSRRNNADYSQLSRISHWSEEDHRLEKELRASR